MGQFIYQLHRTTDSDIIDAFRNIANDLKIEESQIDCFFNFAENHQNPIQTPLSSVESHEELLEICQADGSLIWRIAAILKTYDGLQIEIKRVSGSTTASLIIGKTADSIKVARFLKATHKNFNTFDKLDYIEKFLGPDTAEHYKQREAAISKFEDLHEKHLRRQLKYEQQKDDEYQRKTTEFRENLEQEYKKKEQILNEWQERLETRAKDLDDRDTRLARRSARKQILTILEKAAETFTLTKGTKKLRWPIHALFLTLVGLSFGYIASIAQPFLDPSFEVSPFAMLRLGLGTATLVGTTIFYIRWCDRWFRQHADEEFHLKRFGLDVIRADWLAELAMEWSEQTGSDIPEQLIQRLSHNLFEDEGKPDPAQHPSQDILNRLFSAASGFSLKLPDGSEIKLDGKSIKRFVKKEEKAEKSENGRG